MNTPGQPPSPLGGSSPFGGDNNWQQMLQKFMQNPPQLFPQQQQPMSSPGSGGIWARPVATMGVGGDSNRFFNGT